MLGLILGGNTGLAGLACSVSFSTPLSSAAIVVLGLIFGLKTGFTPPEGFASL